MCVCVREREIVGERECVCSCLRAIERVCLSVRMCVLKRECVSERECV